VDAEDAIGRRIAHARKLRGLTQIGLAARAHVSKSLIAQVESGHKPATPSLIAAVAAAMNADVTDLTGQQRDPGKALACIAKAEQLAPQRTRYHPMARETVSRLLDIHRRMPEPLRGIATRMGLS